MATKLFVGKLSFNTTDEGLLALFSQYGKVVSANVVTDRDTNRSRGFGFVEMEDESDAHAAIQALDGQVFEERTIAVNIARPREDRPRPQTNGNNSFRSGGNGFRRR